MQHLFHFSHLNPQLSASDALHQLVATFQSSSFPQHPLNFMPMPHHAHNPNFQGPSGQRTPGLNGPNHFASPASAAHLNLPTNATSASPATLNMSPAMQNHVLQNHVSQQPQPPSSVGMVAQQSQQGTNTSVGTGSQGTSANTSPNVTNKRRRASAVKVEGDDGGGGVLEVNGTGPKVKASPRVGVKRQKGGA